MSDFTDLFKSKTDPNYLTPVQFIEKEWDNAQKAVNRLPVELQPVASAVLADAKVAVSTGLSLAGDAVAAYIAGGSDVLKQEVVRLLSGVTGGTTLTAASQDGIASAAAALQAVVAYEVAQFQAASSPTAPPLAPPAPALAPAIGH